MQSYRLAIIATHPIQYYAPLFRLLSGRGVVSCHVFYGWQGSALGAARDPGFGRAIRWDIPLLEGYEFSIIPNESRDPGTHHFNGIKSSQLLPAVSQWAPDAVLVYGWNYHSHLKLMRALHRGPAILFRGDSNLIDERRGARTLLRRGALRFVYRYVDIALYVGEHNHEYFRRHGLDESQLRWAPHSIENERFADHDGCYQSAAVAWRRNLGIPLGHTAVLFAGKLEPKKAPDLLLRSFLRCSAENEHLIIVGTGVLEPMLRGIAAGNSRVHFLGFQNQSAMPIVYRLADLFVLPSRGPGETWGLAVNEAMASERPVIASDRVGCAPDLIDAQQSGLMFKSDDSASLESQLVRLMRDSHLRERLGRSSKERIGRWSFDAQASAIEDAVAYAVAVKRS